jgi:hypothetical protein
MSIGGHEPTSQQRTCLSGDVITYRMTVIVSGGPEHFFIFGGVFDVAPSFSE